MTKRYHDYFLVGSKAEGWKLFTPANVRIIGLAPDFKTACQWVEEHQAATAKELATAIATKIATAKRDAFAPTVQGYPEKPESATEYQAGWGYEKPVALGEWSWSTTFGRWGRIVKFACGWEGYTWPKTW